MEDGLIATKFTPLTVVFVRKIHVSVGNCAVATLYNIAIC
jgi:hypothetical protein